MSASNDLNRYGNVIKDSFKAFKFDGCAGRLGNVFRVTLHENEAIHKVSQEVFITGSDRRAVFITEFDQEGLFMSAIAYDAHTSYQPENTSTQRDYPLIRAALDSFLETEYMRPLAFVQDTFKVDRNSGGSETLVTFDVSDFLAPDSADLLKYAATFKGDIPIILTGTLTDGAGHTTGLEAPDPFLLKL